MAAASLAAVIPLGRLLADWLSEDVTARMALTALSAVLPALIWSNWAIRL